MKSTAYLLLGLLLCLITAEGIRAQGIQYHFPEPINAAIAKYERDAQPSHKKCCFKKRKADIPYVISEMHVCREADGTFSIEPVLKAVSDTSSNYYAERSDRFVMVNDRKIPVWFDYDNLLGTISPLSELSGNPEERTNRRLFYILEDWIPSFIIPSDYRAEVDKGDYPALEEKDEIVDILSDIKFEQSLLELIRNSTRTVWAVYLEHSPQKEETILRLLSEPDSTYNQFVSGRKVLLGNCLYQVFFDYDVHLGGLSFLLDPNTIIAGFSFNKHGFSDSDGLDQM